jgi:uncharacterized membrane protein
MRGYPAERADMDVAVAPFSYNPSAWSQRIPIAALALVAFVISASMALYQWRLTSYVWDPFFNTEKVIDSDVAKTMHVWFGIPDAALGAIAYLGDALFGIAGSTRRWHYRPWLVILFGLDVIPLGAVSVILVGVQFFVLGQYCTPCLITAIISLVLIYWAYDEVYASLKFLWLVRKRHGWKAFRQALFGHPNEQADEVAASLASPPERRPSQEDSIGRSVGNWARIVEVGLACWLAVSPFVFRHPTENGLWWLVDWTAAAVLFLVATASFWAPLRRVRWVSLAVSFGLIAFGYLMHQEELPPAALQNHITIGILLLMMAFVPNDAGRPSRAWYEEAPKLTGPHA